MIMVSLKKKHSRLNKPKYFYFKGTQQNDYEEFENFKQSSKKK